MKLLLTSPTNTIEITIFMNQSVKPVIGITCGDLNGIGIELIIKTFSDSHILEYCTLVIFASNKILNFYRKPLPEFNFNWQNIKESIIGICQFR